MSDLKEVLTLLAETNKRLSKIEDVLFQKKEQIIVSGSENISGLARMSKEAGVEEQELRNLIHIEGDDIHLLIDVDSTTDAQNQFIITISLLTFYYYCLGKDSIKSVVLNKKLKHLGVGSLGKLSGNLRQHNKFILPEGKAGSNNFSYKIAYPVGLKEGIKIIKELINNLKKKEN